MAKFDASEIERVIASVDGVSGMAVAARRRPVLEEVPVALVIPRASDEATTRRAHRHRLRGGSRGFQASGRNEAGGSAAAGDAQQVSEAALRKLLGGPGSRMNLVMENG